MFRWFRFALVHRGLFLFRGELILFANVVCLVSPLLSVGFFLSCPLFPASIRVCSSRALPEILAYLQAVRSGYRVMKCRGIFSAGSNVSSSNPYLYHVTM